jgi:hypothetical protein
MSKNILAVCTALAAFAAFSVMAPAASANPVLTHPTGTVLKTGVLIDGTLIGASKLTSGSTDPGTTLLECSKATITGELTKNVTTGTPSIESNITKAEFAGTGANGECTGNFGNATVITTGSNGVPWCLKSIKATDEFEVRGGKCSEAARNIAFIIDGTNTGSCKYEKASFVGTFITHPEDGRLNLTHAGPALKVEGGVLCPSSGSLDMEFTLETDTGTAEPLYLSS